MTRELEWSKIKINTDSVYETDVARSFSHAEFGILVIIKSSVVYIGLLGVWEFFLKELHELSSATSVRRLHLDCGLIISVQNPPLWLHNAI